MKTKYTTVEGHEIKAGECYQTRDGRKAFVSMMQTQSTYPALGVISENFLVESWSSGGESLIGSKFSIDSGKDLMRPWPVKEPSIATWAKSEDGIIYNNLSMIRNYLEAKNEKAQASTRKPTCRKTP